MTKVLILRRTFVPLFVAVAAAPTISLADAPDEEQTSPRRMRMEAFLGYQDWNDLGQLAPAVNGRFDSGGVNLGGAFHWRIRESQRRSVLAGIDLALFSNESDVRHVHEDVISRGLYITPSVKFMFASNRGPRYALDFGLGYYLVDIAELQLFDFGGYAEQEIWEDSVFGGYLGASVDFPLEASKWNMGFSMSAKIHYFSLGTVRDESLGPGVPVTLGPDAGRLSGPVVMLQFGVHWF